MREAFFQLLFPPRYRVLGRWLPPLSLWHVAALESLGSPFLHWHEGKQFDLADLQVAVRICLTQWPDQPSIKPGFRELWQSFRHRKDERYLRKEANIFGAYLARHLIAPEIWEDDTESPRYLTAPSVLSRVAGLSALPAFSQGDIWNRVTPGYALWLLCADAERRSGAVRFWTEEDEFEQQRAANAELLEARSDEENYRLAVEHLGQAGADAWLAARKQSRKAGTLPEAAYQTAS